jgi:hypothetical protein
MQIRRRLGGFPCLKSLMGDATSAIGMEDVYVHVVVAAFWRSEYERY